MTSLNCPPPSGADIDVSRARDASAVARTAALIGASALAGLFLAACGGGGDGFLPPPPPPVPITQVPASAAESSASLEAFALSQPASETEDSLTLELVPTFPTSEVEDPIILP